jgi:hypothetical protein
MLACLSDPDYGSGRYGGGLRAAFLVVSVSLVVDESDCLVEVRHTSANGRAKRDTVLDIGTVAQERRPLLGCSTVAVGGLYTKIVPGFRHWDRTVFFPKVK